MEVADLTDTPVILIVDMKGRSLSALASIKGFMEYQERNHVAGVIFNRLSSMIYPGLKKKAEQELGIRVFRIYIPELRDLTLESRHLGLVMPEEIRAQGKAGACKGEDPCGDRSGWDTGSSGGSSGTSN